ncbi:Cationic amino acid transporter 1 [Zostera marina]|uniref:Cationic amino acid transporter 1 n=1 Tax=Zostera marina TaxID=29655 RepID=A0A0K9P867_ZOSMR|nr:Cationic amino acid transporter 1 [Zostera marina]
MSKFYIKCVLPHILYQMESFKSLANYRSAIAKTPQRLWTGIKSRSLDSHEINELTARSGSVMKKNLTWWDLICFGIGSVIGAGIFVLTGLQARNVAGPAIILSFVVSGISALLSVLCYTEFAIDIPVAGGSFAYLRVELGEFVAYIAAGNIILEYIISTAAVARAWTSYFATLFNYEPNNFRIHVDSLPEDLSYLDPIAVAIIAIICVLVVYSTKTSSTINIVASVIHVASIIFMIIAGLTKADLSNIANFAPFGVQGIFNSSAVLFFAYVGFDAVSTLAEETKNPAKDIPIGLVGAMTITIVVYCALSATLCLMQPYDTIDVNAPFSIAFQHAGMKWAKIIVALGALKGMTTVLMGSAVGQARYLTHMARTNLVPSFLAKVHPKYGTPMNASITMLGLGSVVALFTGIHILADLLSISALFIFMLVAVGLLVRRYYVTGQTSKLDRNKLVGSLVMIIASSVATSFCYAQEVQPAICYGVTLPFWFLSTLYMQVFVPKARTPKVWGVPFVPWLPSLSIFLNIFLLGSIDPKSFVRFSIWTGILLLYYCLVGVHVAHDHANKPQPEPMIERVPSEQV